MRTEKEIRTNAPFTLFEIGQKKYKAKAMAINDAEEWLDKASEVDEAAESIANAVASFDANAKKIARKAYSEALIECVCSYNGDWDKDEIANAITAEQLVDAFQLMKEISDPFERKQLQELQKMQRQMKGMGGIPDELIMKALSATQKPPS